jgi:hypothetical protein
MHELTWQVEDFDDSEAVAYDAIGLIGDFNSWGGDVPLEQSDYDENIWFIDNLELTEGKVKFRANGNWDKNWGGPNDTGPNVDDVCFPWYKGEQFGVDIPISAEQAGTYFVKINTLTGHYVFLRLDE